MKILKYSWLLLFLINSKMAAQELSVVSNIGVLSGYKYDYMETSSNLRPGFTLGVLYSQKISDYLSLESGIEYALINTKFSIGQTNTIMNISDEIDANGSAFQMQTSLKGYQETSKTQALIVPLMLFYKKAIGGNTEASQPKLAVGAGLKYVKPLNQNTESTVQKLTISGYYPDKNLLIDDLPEAGFGAVDNFKSEYKNELQQGVVAFSAEFGFEYFIGKIRLFTGVYGDYALSNMKNENPNQTTSLVKYDPTGISSVGVGTITQQSVKEAKYLSLGLVIKIPFYSK